MIARILACCLLLTTLAACGGSAPAVQIAATQAPVTDLPTAAAAPAALATTAIPMAIEASTTAAATKSADLAAPTQKGYITLVLVKGVAVMLDDTAQQIQAGKLKGFESFGHLIVVGAIYKAINDNIAKDAPDPALNAAWEQGRILLPKLRDVLSQWTNKKITSADVPGLTAPIHTEIDQMLDTAEADLGTAYGADPAKLKVLRDKAITDLQNTLQATPTPKP